eukprot:916732-Amphidinium_carterae.1
METSEHVEGPLCLCIWDILDTHFAVPNPMQEMSILGTTKYEYSDATGSEWQPFSRVAFVHAVGFVAL